MEGKKYKGNFSYLNKLIEKDYLLIPSSNNYSAFFEIGFLKTIVLQKNLNRIFRYKNTMLYLFNIL